MATVRLKRPCFAIAANSERLNRIFWRPEEQVSEVEFDRLLTPVLGHRYSVVFLTVDNRVIIKFDKNTPRDNENGYYMERKERLYRLLNEWGCAQHVYTGCVKKIIQLMDEKDSELPITVPTDVYHVGDGETDYYSD